MTSKLSQMLTQKMCDVKPLGSRAYLQQLCESNQNCAGVVVSNGNADRQCVYGIYSGVQHIAVLLDIIPFFYVLTDLPVFLFHPKIGFFFTKI